jgi:hypothetical protein
MQRLEGNSMKRIKHNDLVPWFIQDHGTLPASYLASCKKFFKELSDKQQAASVKPQALIQKNLHKPGTRVKNRFNRKV